MALELRITYKGVDAEYWKIMKTVIEYKNGITDEDKATFIYVELALYADRIVRIANVNNYLLLRGYSFKDVPVATQEDIYTRIKLLPEFEGAQDD